MLLENTGTPTSPEFDQPTVFMSNRSTFELNRLEINDCAISGEQLVLIDIDADGDLDRFNSSFLENSLLMSYTFCLFISNQKRRT
ncbi:MAG: hypothetical protein V3U87_06265 [Methylococcaceae bacterium]